MTRSPVRIVWALVAAVLAIGVVGGPAHSQTADVEELEHLALDLPEGVDASVSPPSTSLMMDSANRRAYQLMRTFDGRTVMRSFDLDTRRKLLEKEIPFQAFPGGPVAPFTEGVSAEWVHTVDPSTGTVFIGFLQLGMFGGVTAIDGATLEVKKIIPRPIVNVDPGSIGCTSGACLPQPPTIQPALRGMSYVSPELTGNPPKLLLLMEEGVNSPATQRNFNLPWIAQWDITTGRQDFIYRVASCSNNIFPNGQYQLAIFQARLGAGIYLGCAAGGGTGQVVRITLDGNGRPEREFAYPGPLQVTDVIGDPEADRVLLKVLNEEGESWWVFDGGASAYVGVIGITVQGSGTATGIDERSGRLYVLSGFNAKGNQSNAGGILMSDTRRSPTPQVLSYEQFAERGTGALRVDTHPETGVRTIYARPEKKPYYRVFRDNTSITDDPSVEDQDRLTVDVEEKDGMTGRTFGGSGHAFGFRALLVGGANGFPPTGPDIGGVRIGRHTPTWLNSPCGTGDRELVAASIRSAGLSNDIAAASAIVAESDAGTKTDLGEPTARCYPRPTDTQGNDIWDQLVDLVGRANPDAAKRIADYPRLLETELDDQQTGDDEPRTDVDEVLGTDWMSAPVECSGDSADGTFTRLRPLDRGDTETGPIPPEDRDRRVDLQRFQAKVDCRQSDAVVKARSELLVHEEQQPAVEVAIPEIGMVRIAEISAETAIFLDPDKGLVARSTAMARGISIGDDIEIDAAFTIGEAWAKGRPGTAATRFTRRICGVRIKDQAPDQHVFRPIVEPDQRDPLNSKVDPQGGGEVNKNVNLDTCGDPEMSALGQQPVIDAMNRVFGTRARASAPAPDGKLSQGTPGGYLASVQKDRFEAISARAVNNDQSTQVPAFELIVFNDDPNEGRGRQIYQFAGVDASVTYGIYLLNPDETFFDDFDDLPTDLIDFTGGPILPTTPTDGPAQLPRGSTRPTGGIVAVLYEGTTFLLQNPRDALLAAAVWAVLFAPVHLAGRRRMLRRLA